MTTPRIERNYEEYTDEQCEQLKIGLLNRKLEALRIYRDARQCLMDVTADYNHKMELINKSRDKIKRKDSNHKGMD